MFKDEKDRRSLHLESGGRAAIQALYSGDIHLR